MSRYRIAQTAEDIVQPKSARQLLAVEDAADAAATEYRCREPIAPVNAKYCTALFRTLDRCRRVFGRFTLRCDDSGATACSTSLAVIRGGHCSACADPCANVGRTTSLHLVTPQSITVASIGSKSCQLHQTTFTSMLPIGKLSSPACCSSEGGRRDHRTGRRGNYVAALPAGLCQVAAWPVPLRAVHAGLVLVVARRSALYSVSVWHHLKFGPHRLR